MQISNGQLMTRRGTIDLRVPEARIDYGEPIMKSAAVDRWVRAFYLADSAGDGYGRRNALKGVVDSYRADHAAAGVPVYAHAPLPTDFVDGLLTAIASLPESDRQAAWNELMADVEPSSRPLVARQFEERASEPKPFRAVGYRQDGDPDSPEARKRADELDERDPVAALAHPFAYGGDAAMDDMFGEEGLLGDWGWRRTIPSPSGLVPGAVGELTRGYLETGPFLVGRAGAAGRAAGRGSKAGGAARGAGSRTSKELARPFTCRTSCHCRAIAPGAKCPPFVYGVGSGPTTAMGCSMAEKMANFTVPVGCQKRHCNCRCSK